MGEIKNFPKYKLIIGILTSLYNKIDDIIEMLSVNFGEIDYTSPVLDFNYTDYYNNEIGNEIKRFFVSFKELISPSSISAVKIASNNLEKLFIEKDSCKEKRKVNLDPGILNSSRLILATTKDNVHRIPLKDGIYGEVTLIFQKGKFEPLPWTYIDYRSPEYCEILLKIRTIYKINLKTNF